MYRISILPKASKGLSALPKQDQKRVETAIDLLGETPRPVGCVKLAGYLDLVRIRIGHYRVVYRIDDAGEIVIILIIAHRRDVYRGL